MKMANLFKKNKTSCCENTCDINYYKCLYINTNMKLFTYTEINIRICFFVYAIFDNIKKYDAIGNIVLFYSFIIYNLLYRYRRR